GSSADSARADSLSRTADPSARAPSVRKSFRDGSGTEFHAPFARVQFHLALRPAPGARGTVNQVPIHFHRGGVSPVRIRDRTRATRNHLDRITPGVSAEPPSSILPSRTTTAIAGRPSRVVHMRFKTTSLLLTSSLLLPTSIAFAASSS